MAFALVQAGSNSNNGGTDVAVTLSAVASGNLLIGCAVFANGSGQAVSGVTDDKSNTYTLGTAAVDVADAITVQAFWCGNITNAPTIITVTVDGAANPLGAIVEEWSGCFAAADPNDDESANVQASPGTNTDAITSGTITTTVAGDLIWGACRKIGGVGISIPGAGTGFTQGTTAILTRTEYQTQAAAGATAATYTAIQDAPMITVGVALKAALVALPWNSTSLPWKA